MPERRLNVGIAGDATTTVRPENVAARVADGAVSMFSTPAMIGLMEQAAYNAVTPHLDEGQTTVGTAVDVRHLAATPLGLEVRAHAELTEVDGRRLRFKVAAYDPAELIGEGWHERFVVDEARFRERADRKVQP